MKEQEINIKRKAKSPRKTTEKFIEDAKKVHGNKFDYSLSKYEGAKFPIKIICSKHGIFEQQPNDHLNGSGCKFCANWGNLMEIEGEFIRRAREIHGEKYDYSESEYTNHDTLLKIKCQRHGEFFLSPKSHLILKIGCVKCKSERMDGWIRSNAFTQETFISLAKEVHGDLYDYSKSEYFSMKKKIIIICKKHGEFEQQPKSHINKAHGCPKCRSSKGEQQILNYLNNNNIICYTQHAFEKCIYIRKLPFDFYLPEYNTCIEYDGFQHFEPVKWFGGLKALLDIQRNDKIKTEFCKDNNIKLLRIKYDQNITEILNQHYE